MRTNRKITKTYLVLDIYTKKKYIASASARLTTYKETDIDTIEDFRTYDFKHDRYLTPVSEKEKVKEYIKSRKYNELDIRKYVLDIIKKNKDNILKKEGKKELEHICKLFDKGEKMLGRADTRSNNINEANVSYEFLMKIYETILEIIEREK